MKQSKHLTILLITLIAMPTILMCFGCSPAKPSKRNIKELVKGEFKDGHGPGLLRILYRRSNHKWANFADGNFGWGVIKDSSIFSAPSLVDRNQILIDGNSIEIKSIEIKQWGIYNKDEKYWPCKIRIIGSATVTGRRLKPQKKHFDAVVNFRFSKEDYGNWELEFDL